ncbi:hypothetical protein [Sphingobium baderi]|uniref:hypothetical protein n=1 Tax=Sphingobium baderi TaxID=1332080 RepID=UPI002B406106|nr:hypothetical protein [Sphingobium baderi]WRD78727.1 hypothetical protein QQ987_20290 [Sphingobium baderi]
MPDAIDLGGAPADEDCAQLGQTEDFARLNRLEVATYRAAMIARFGQPPEGCAFVTLANRHDFGIYRTLGLTIDAGSAHSDAAVLAYSQAAQDGLSSWVEAGFAPPVRYDDDGVPTLERESIADIVMGAILATRPDATGRYPVPDFERLHQNLVAAYPGSAEAANAILQEISA